jgi:hypothetical protein
MTQATLSPAFLPDDVVVTVEIDERIALGAVDHLSLIVLEHVVYRHDAIFLDIHVAFLV